MSRELLWQVIAHPENAKPIIIGSDKDKFKAFEIARLTLSEKADLYCAVTIKKSLLGGGA